MTTAAPIDLAGLPVLNYDVSTGVFVWLGRYPKKELRRLDPQPKRAGFAWAAQRMYWYTRDADHAMKLVQYADPPTRDVLGGYLPAKTRVIEASRALRSDIAVPVPPGLHPRTGRPFALRDYQLAALEYIVMPERPYENALVGDEPRVGKTPTAIGLMNMRPDLRKVLVICPSTPRINWLREIELWSTTKRWVTIARDSFPVSADVVIINYDRLHRFARALQSIPWGLVVVDEAHRLKNPTTRWSKVVYGDPERGTSGIQAELKIAMTGTAIVNRPMEIYPLAHWLAPKEYNDQRAFKKLYGKASAKTPIGRRQLRMLQERLRATIMVRRRFAEVAPQVPPKQREIIEIDPGEAAAAIKEESAQLLESVKDFIGLRVAVELAKADPSDEVYKVATKAMSAYLRGWFSRISTLRRQTAVAKLPAVIDHLREALETGEKIIVFGHHREVIETIYETFKDVAVRVDGTMTGDKGMRERQAAVDAFQRPDGAQLFVGSIYAAGVAITLDAGNWVVFAELDWVPGIMTQAEARGDSTEKDTPILVQHLVLEGSLDAHVARTIVDKQHVIEQAMDSTDDDLGDPIVPLGDECATEGIPRGRIATAANRLDAAACKEVEDALRGLKLAEQAYDASPAFGTPEGFRMGQGDRLMTDALLAGAPLTARQAALAMRIVIKYQRPEDNAALGITLQAKETTR